MTTNEIEILASLEHQRWSDWQRHLHDRCTMNADGSLTIPSEYVKYLEDLIQIPYDSLPEDQKQRDRREVHRYLYVLESVNGPP